MRLLRSSWYGFLYYVSWLLFGVGGVLLNLALGPLLLWPRRAQLGPLGRRAIQQMFILWLKWLHATGVVHVRWHGFEGRTLPRGTVYVANHPTLVDATFLLARLPDAVCIFKPTLLRNPAIAPAALLAEYLAGDQGVDTIRSAAERVASGRSLLVFPEGTRTRAGLALNPLRPGFALIARRATAPVQILRIEASPQLTTHGRPWWHLPPLPGRVDIYCGQQISVDEGTETQQLVHAVAERLQAPSDS